MRGSNHCAVRYWCASDWRWSACREMRRIRKRGRKRRREEMRQSIWWMTWRSQSKGRVAAGFNCSNHNSDSAFSGDDQAMIATIVLWHLLITGMQYSLLINCLFVLLKFHNLKLRFVSFFFLLDWILWLSVFFFQMFLCPCIFLFSSARFSN
jgi:hypothetical protein